MTDPVLLSVRDLKVHFDLPSPGPFQRSPKVHAVDGVSFSIRRGTTFGLVGESGSGKSTLALAVMRLVDATAGEVLLDGENLLALKPEALRRQRRRFQMIFQDPFSSLNPRMTAGAVVREPMDLMGIGTADARDDEVAELFAKVGLSAEQRVLYPHQFSGGQRQRIGIARALATKPDLIICDEPVSALDVAIQAQILNLLSQLQRDFGLTYLFISHDLGVVQHMCEEIGVMYLGEIVEHGDRDSLFRAPLHPYTWALRSAVPSAERHIRSQARRVRLEGDPPSPIDPAPGCRFASRCPFAEERCRAETPKLRAASPTRSVACHLVDGATATWLNKLSQGAELTTGTPAEVTAPGAPERPAALKRS